ncbi:MAG TPA: hypothetical protein VNX21_00580, partial [Candidatus Thermoplasmatota archaeon]|nr:hypothetical protein [Candidatus Thermoplasmatota archaeon]
MLRLLLQLLALLGAPLLDVAADAPAGPVAVAPHPSAAGLTRVSVDASLLPASTGWFLVPVTLAKDAYVDVDARYAAGPATAAVVLVGHAQGTWALATHGAGWSGLAEANREDLRVGCCDPANASALARGPAGGAAGTRFVRAGETVWVGLAAVGWGQGGEMRVNLTTAEPVLQAGPARTGARVEAVDLADDARRNGTNVRAMGGMVAGKAGVASREWTARGTGLLVLDAWADGNATARLHVRLPGGTLLEDESLARSRVSVLAAQPGGAFAVRLREVRDAAPGLLGGAGALHARALYADLDAPLAGSGWSATRPT